MGQIWMLMEVDPLSGKNTFEIVHAISNLSLTKEKDEDKDLKLSESRGKASQHFYLKRCP